MPRVSFSHLEFKLSFPSPHIHLLSTFNLWPLDFEGGDNLHIRVCSGEWLASPSLSEIQPFSFGVGERGLLFLPWHFLISPREQDPSKAFLRSQAGFMECSRFCVVAVAWSGCELHGYKAEWSFNNYLDVCDGRIHARWLVCPEHLSVLVTQRGSKLLPWKGGSTVRFPQTFSSLDLLQGPVLLWPCSVALQTSRFFRAAQR